MGLSNWFVMARKPVTANAVGDEQSNRLFARPGGVCTDRPVFDDPAVDKLLAMVTAAGRVCVLRSGSIRTNAWRPPGP
jgi:hypothetical protein